MSLTSYSGLQTAIADWADRADLDAKIPDFIELAEARINKILRIRQMERRSQMSTIGNDAYYGLPPGWLSGRALSVQNASVRGNYDLEYRTPESFDQMGYDINGVPKYYTVIGNELKLRPTPDAVYTVQTVYYKKLDSLSDSQTGNEVLSDYPDIYLYACLLEAAVYLKDKDAAMSYGKLFEAAVTGAQDADSADRHSGGAMHVVGEQIGI
jgi:hypothetical protein